MNLRIAFYSREFRLCEWPEEPKEGIDYWKESLGSTSYGAALKRYNEAVTSAMENGIPFADQEGVKQFIFKTTNEIRGTMLIWQPKEGDNWPAPEGVGIEYQCLLAKGGRWICVSKYYYDSFFFTKRMIAVLKSESVEKKETGAEKAIKATDRREQIMQLLEKYYDKVPLELVHALDRLNQSTPKE